MNIPFAFLPLPLLYMWRRLGRLMFKHPTCQQKMFGEVGAHTLAVWHEQKSLLTFHFCCWIKSLNFLFLNLINFPLLNNKT